MGAVTYFFRRNIDENNQDEIENEESRAYKSNNICINLDNSKSDIKLRQKDMNKNKNNQKYKKGKKTKKKKIIKIII